VARRRVTARPPKLEPGETININTASARGIESASGIGKTKAQAIMITDNQNGNFNTPEDIQKVKGIKAWLLMNKLKDYNQGVVIGRSAGAWL
jgi:competence protein ComEA